VSILPKHNHFHLRPYRDEPSASRPIRADKHRRGQRVLTWVTSREHCAAAGNFFSTSQQPTKQDRPQVAQVGSFAVLVVTTLLCVSFDIGWNNFERETASRNFCQQTKEQLELSENTPKKILHHAGPSQITYYKVLNKRIQVQANKKGRPRMNTTQTGQIRAWQRNCIELESTSNNQTEKGEELKEN
jgi:hypothetical protein